MKVVLIFMIFLLLSPLVMAQNITLPNITIKIPRFNSTTLFNITILNETRINDVLEVFGVDVYDILKERVNRAIDYLFNRIAENIARTVNESLPQIVEILIRGNSTNQTS
jgi:hypothetical protein